MAGDDPEDQDHRPTNPYAPPPPGGQHPYGQSPYAPGAYGTPYRPEPKKSSVPLWIGTLLGLVLAALLAVASWSLGDLGGVVVVAGLIAVILLAAVPATRRWGIGLIMGLLLAVPLSTIVLAGVCVYWIASSSTSS